MNIYLEALDNDDVLHSAQFPRRRGGGVGINCYSTGINNLKKFTQCENPPKFSINYYAVE